MWPYCCRALSGSNAGAANVFVHHEAPNVRAFSALILSTALVGGSACDKPKKPDIKTRASRHPNPKAGIDGSRVLSSYKLSGSPKAVLVFDMVRENPEVMDAIRCNCN
jgi:hypothetical protein